MIKQECIGIPDMILLLMIFCFKKIKIKAEIVLSPGGAYFKKYFHSNYFHIQLIATLLYCEHASLNSISHIFNKCDTSYFFAKQA